MLNYMMQNPWRSPQWRWLRADSIINNEGPLTTPRRDGPDGYKWIRRAAQFKRIYNQYAEPYMQCQLAMEMPAIFWAHHVWADDNGPTKWAIEAHILARETDKEIAWKIGSSPEVVAAYEAIFFNVREKLNYREYILNSVMSDSVTRGISERHYDLLWKLFGYTGGPHVLDSMISRLVNPMWCARSDDVPNFFQDAALNIMKRKAAVASLTVPINSNTQLNLIDAFVKYVEIERTTDSLGKAQDQIVTNLQAMLGSLPFGVATKQKDQSKMVAGYDQSSVELSANELMVVGLGAALPYGDQLQNLSFPTPPVKNSATLTHSEMVNESSQQGSGDEDPARKRGGRRSRQRRPKPE
jgi:hypothetical protein